MIFSSTGSSTIGGASSWTRDAGRSFAFRIVFVAIFTPNSCDSDPASAPTNRVSKAPEARNWVWRTIAKYGMRGAPSIALRSVLAMPCGNFATSPSARHLAKFEYNLANMKRKSKIKLIVDAYLR
jgi:hypothetical protein